MCMCNKDNGLQFNIDEFLCQTMQTYTTILLNVSPCKIKFTCSGVAFRTWLLIMFIFQTPALVKSLLTVHHQHSSLCAYYSVDVIPYDILTAFTQLSLALNPSNVFTTVR